MKSTFTNFLLFIIPIFITACAEDWILDDNVSEEWNGEGIPSWASDRIFDYQLESGWGASSYFEGELAEVFSFTHKNNLLAAIKYSRGIYEKVERGTLYYTRDGRKVNEGKVKESFDKTAKLVWSNEIGSIYRPIDIGKLELEDSASMAWFQDKLNIICKEFLHSDFFLAELTFGCDESENHFWISYTYNDCKEPHGLTRISKAYTRSGEEITNFSNIDFIKLCKEITHIKDLRK